MGEVYRFSRERLPDWFLWELNQENIPLEFDLDLLTEEQEKHLCLIINLYSLAKNGFVEVIFDGVNPPRFRITEKGLKLIRQIQDEDVGVDELLTRSILTLFEDSGGE